MHPDAPGWSVSGWHRGVPPGAPGAPLAPGAPPGVTPGPPPPGPAMKPRYAEVFRVDLGVWCFRRFETGGDGFPVWFRKSCHERTWSLVLHQFFFAVH